MKTRTGMTAIGGLGLAVGLAIVSSILMMNGPDAERAEAALGIAMVPMPLVGMLIALRRPGNAVGWLLIATGILWGGSVFADSYLSASTASAEPLPAYGWMGWLGTWMWFVAVSIIGGFMLFVFPSGRLPSPRWKPVIWFSVVVVVIGTLGNATDPEPMVDGIRNPLASEATVFEVARTLQVLFVAVFFLAAASLIMRFRRSSGIERQQLKWLVYAASVLPPAIAVAATSNNAAGAVAWFTLLFMAILGIPIVIGIAILRYRLYDIDLVINRTLVYAALTALLALVYLFLVATVSTIAGDSDLVTAASTLAVAGLFNPLRRRVQEQVDHIFYRRKYDARRTVDAFSSRLRDEIDLESVNAELIDTVHRTMHPAHVSVWLKKGAQA